MDTEFLCREILLGAGFIHAGNSSVKSTKWSDWFHGIISPEGQPDAERLKFPPRIRVPGALFPDTRLCPVHISKKMVWLDGGNDTQRLKLHEIIRRDDLVM